MKYKKGDKVILNLHTKCGDCCIPEREHNKEFTIGRVYPIKIYDRWDYFIKDKRGYTWYVKEPMLSLYNPQMLFSFMYE